MIDSDGHVQCWAIFYVLIIFEMFAEESIYYTISYKKIKGSSTRSLFVLLTLVVIF